MSVEKSGNRERRIEKSLHNCFVIMDNHFTDQDRGMRWQLPFYTCTICRNSMFSHTLCVGLKPIKICSLCAHSSFNKLHCVKSKSWKKKKSRKCGRSSRCKDQEYKKRDSPCICTPPCTQIKDTWAFKTK